MSVFGRISDILTANVGALLDRAEDPERMLAQVIREMEEGLDRARRYGAAAIAGERSLGRDLRHHQTQAGHWRGKAKQYLDAGREDLARGALRQGKSHETAAHALEIEHALAKQDTEALRAALQALQARLEEAQSKQRWLRARHGAALARQGARRWRGCWLADDGNLQDRFARFAGLLERRSDELLALEELESTATGFPKEAMASEAEQELSQELEKLKKENDTKAT
jgi:phage shock protein A